MISIYIIIGSEASDFIFKIIFHGVHHGYQLYTMGLIELDIGGGGRV